MKPLFVLLLLTVAGFAQATATAPRRPELRETLHKYDARRLPEPRQLSAAERAALRRQLAEQDQRRKPDPKPEEKLPE